MSLPGVDCRSGFLTNPMARWSGCSNATTPLIPHMHASITMSKSIGPGSYTATMKISTMKIITVVTNHQHTWDADGPPMAMMFVSALNICLTTMMKIIAMKCLWRTWKPRRKRYSRGAMVMTMIVLSIVKIGVDVILDLSHFSDFILSRRLSS
ncbi:hypothetical protein BAE44_0001810 [Dichanthelium oligosanthes]|uniref:Uncharacterized protein n=1 Tax=Dichanthelium oligosanthes TaxID=888268 RepID=A0A1E5WIG4_9POAL|nr:hypothetical protein BAE44_0001810 [Dichanthelium oligosanthes]